MSMVHLCNNTHLHSPNDMLLSFDKLRVALQVWGKCIERREVVGRVDVGLCLMPFTIKSFHYVWFAWGIEFPVLGPVDDTICTSPVVWIDMQE